MKLEIRFLRAYVIRANGIHSISDLIDLDPNALFNYHVKWTDVGDRFVQNVVRTAVREDRKRYAGIETSESVDRYRAAIPHRVKALLQRMGTDRAQVVRDSNPRRQANALPMPLSIPTCLTWVTPCRPRAAIATATVQDTEQLNSDILHP